MKLWPWTRVPKHPILQENASCFSQFDQTSAIETYDFVAFDTELTGLNPKRDEIVSIGAVRIKDLRIVLGESFFSYVRPTGNLPKSSTLIHGISPQQIEDAPGIGEVLPEFVAFCGKALLIGHYVGIDMAFLNKALRKHLGGTMSNPCVDSMKLAEVFQDHRSRSNVEITGLGKSYNLAVLAREYGLPLFTQHDALEDALQTAYLFLFLVKNLKEAGYLRLRDFYTAGKLGPHHF
ncbi:3'-5' exonuclease [Desulfomonile tiedjei]|uniref:Exonuclease, DNA polymerase III, epsilon subunit family n=1 Tax=Desulfomonile tiedjei (strain ATCC 49306 / DSM 6799 / DCB-1) TaxID=706587 RepID=I4C638_DESTA|nr:3'-5' exonuclease [Desulfomonile tiedjei]AFM25029.1 exonuclease, DNA polymerase III, epsilon subunit family [Desulfomonile tiedjei DSM 6799]